MQKKGLKVLSLFDGMSGTMLALNKLGVPVDTYYASEIDKYAEAESAANFPDIVRLGDVTKWQSWNIPWEEIDLLVGGFPCFPAGTYVQTDKGPVDIKDIQIGDKVLTHTGRYHTVLDKGEKYAPTRIIKGQGHLPIECTDEHPFYACTKDGSELTEAQWVDAKDLTTDHYLCNVKMKESFSTKSDKTEAFWYFAGRFMGDGWTLKVRRKHRKESFSYSVFICCVIDEFDELKKCFDEMGMKYGFQKERTVYKFYICSKELLEYFELMGKGASNKKPHPDIYTETLENQHAFIRGYMDADGHYDKHNYCTKFTTTSIELVVGMQRLIMNVFGKHSNVLKNTTPETKEIEGRIVNQRPWYSVSFNSTTAKSPQVIYDGDYVWLKGCKENTSTEEFKTVYNLEVDVDNTYVVNNIVVHNCQAWSVAGKQGGTTDPRGMLFHTLMDIWTHMKELNPNLLYLFENVKMKDDFKNYISGVIGSEPFFINSEDFTAQNRQRYYWCNWDVPAPTSTGPSLTSILESGYVDRNKSYCIDANYYKGAPLTQYFLKSRRQMVFLQQPIDKAWLLQHGKNKVHYRKLTVKECCRLQGAPDDYIKVSSDTQAYKMLGNGFTIPVISYILQFGLNKKP